jgi:hypothetical protein
MSKIYKSLTIFTLLILCMVSVWIAPVFLGTSTPAMEFTETDAEPFEFEEELILVNCGTAGLIFAVRLRIGGTHLNMLPAALARVFSPPKPFSS